MFTTGQYLFIIFIVYSFAVSLAVWGFCKCSTDAYLASLFNRWGIYYYIVLWFVMFVFLIPAICSAVSKTIEEYGDNIEEEE